MKKWMNCIGIGFLLVVVFVMVVGDLLVGELLCDMQGMLQKFYLIFDLFLFVDIICDVIGLGVCMKFQCNLVGCLILCVIGNVWDVQIICVCFDGSCFIMIVNCSEYYNIVEFLCVIVLFCEGKDVMQVLLECGDREIGML